MIHPDLSATNEQVLAADFRALFGSADLGIVRFDTVTHRILAANDCICTILGYARGGLTGATTDSLIDPTDTTTRRIFHAAQIDDCPPDHAGRLLARDGTVVEVRVAAALVHDSDGIARRSIALIRDLTGVNRAAAGAADDRQRTHLALEAATAGAWEFRIVDRTLIWSPELLALYDLPPDAPMPSYRVWRTFVHPDDALAAEPPMADVIDDAYSTEFRIRVGDSWRWLGSRARIVRDAAGAPTRVVGINIDQTEARDATDAMAAAVARFRAAVEAMQGVLWTNSPAGEMLGEQPGWAALTGQTPAEYQGYGWSAAIHPDDAAPTIAAWNAAVAARGAFVFEHRVRVADGSYRCFAVRALPVIADGAIREWVGVHTDVHDARTADEALQARVAEAVTAREAALAQLHEAQKLETIGQLTGGVAHDFNNLLTPIIGSLDLLARRAPEPRAAKLIDGALTAAERAKTLVQRLLAFSRRQSLESRAVDIAALIAGVHDLLTRSLGPGITLVVVAEGEILAEVDPAQLELAVLNLALNARDAMAGNGTLTITATHAADDGRDYVRLTVADTGSGMDETTRRRAIEPFFTTKAVGRGTGLGLSMVHGLAAQSGGRLELDSAPGEGTRAHLWLPVARALPAEASPEALVVPKVAARGAGQRLLVVDDEPLVRAATSAMLADLGYAVVEADGPASACALFGDAIDAVVTDYLMPERDGAALAADLRRKRPTLPVLVVTGYAAGEVLDPTIGRLAKPFLQIELAAAVADIFARA
jgi:PAS domain S-box-containing protein